MRFSSCVIGIPALVFLSGHLSVAQQVAVGLKGGVRTADDVSGSLTSESKRYIMGPMVEIRLPLRLSLELDALYRRFGFTGGSSSVFGHSITRERANSWEFPMILKYNLPVVLAHPFVGAGYAPRTIHGTDVSSGSFLSGTSQNPPMSIYTNYFNQRSDTRYSLTHGVVVSGGVNLRAGHARFSPELRYVHWNAPFLSEFGGDGSFQFVSKQDEFLVLLGVSWH
jgi:hypothetical protein